LFGQKTDYLIRIEIDKRILNDCFAHTIVFHYLDVFMLVYLNDFELDWLQNY
jgi:hypothetical protein